jgi:hypothetical protein
MQAARPRVARQVLEQFLWGDGVGLMADVPAWYWQVLGAVFGLGLGIFIGAVRRGQPRSKARPASAPQTPAGQQRAARSEGPPTVIEPRGDGTPQRLLERLREQNLDLTAKLRAATDLHAREMLDRSHMHQGDEQRHARQLEELRQAHSSELSHLMTVMVEQVDGMQRDHANHLRVLEAEIERLKQVGHAGDSVGSEPTRPITVMTAGDMNPNQTGGSARAR